MSFFGKQFENYQQAQARYKKNSMSFYQRNLSPSVVSTLLSQLRYSRRLQYCLILSCLPLVLGFSLDLLDDIQIVAIHDIQLRHAEGQYILDAVIEMQNTGTKKLKLRDCSLSLALLPNGVERIPLGTAQIDEILFVPQTEAGAAVNNVKFALRLGNNLQDLQHNLFLSSKEMALLLLEPEPKLKIALQGQFNLGIQTNQLWVYKDGMTIDWTLTPSITKEALAKFVLGMSTIIAHPSKADEYTPTPKIMAMVTEQAVQSPSPTSAAGSSLEVTRPGMSKQAGLATVTGPNMTVYFATGSTTLDRKAQKTLQQWAATQLQKTPEAMMLCIEGHADKNGTPQNNQAVSLKRAETVVHYLIDTLNMTIYDVVMIKGLGAKELAIEVDGKEADQHNRRVEIYFARN